MHCIRAGHNLSDVVDLTVCSTLQVAHVTGDVQFPKTKDGRVAMGWAAAQAATTADFSHGSWFWTHFSGGLNYQVQPLCKSCNLGKPAITIPVAWTCRAATCCPLLISLAWPHRTEKAMPAAV